MTKRRQRRRPALIVKELRDTQDVRATGADDSSVAPNGHAGW